MAIISEIEKAHPDIKAFLHREFLKIRQSPFLEEILSAHIHPLVLEDRYPVVMGKINQILIQT